MKKFLTFLSTLLVSVLCVTFAACGTKEPVKADENTVIITAVSSSFDFENKTLKEYMDFLQDEEKLTYEIESGMVTSINGKASAGSSFWMLYTNDKDNANEEWGTFDNDGEIYGSATLGVTELKVKENCVYVWTYQTF